MELTAQKRDIFGKACKKLREQGLVPGEVYGNDMDSNIHVSVNSKDLKDALREAGESTVVNLRVEDNVYPVLIYGIEHNHLTSEYTSVDFYQVNMNEVVTTEVPLKLIGEAPAVKELSGVLITVIDEVEVEALPADLPHEIEIDLSSLNEIGSSIHVKDLKLPKGVKVNNDVEAVVVTISEQAEEEEQAAPVDVSAVKVEGEEKRAKEDEENKE